MQQEKWKSEVLVCLLLFAFIFGAIFFDVKVYQIGYRTLLDMVVALVIGFFAYLYSFVFITIGITWLFFLEKEWDFRNIILEISIGFELLSVAIIIQLFFWGTIKDNDILILIGGILFAIIAVYVACTWIKILKQRRT